MKQEDILTEVFEDIWDMDLKQLRDFHGAFALNVLASMQEVTQQDITKEFVTKHKALVKKLIK